MTDPMETAAENLEMTTHDVATGRTDGIDSLLQPWRHMAIQLSPLIGDSGFCALYNRAARLASVRFPWLLPLQSGKSIDAVLLALRVLFAAAGRSDAALANEAILNTFTKLLAGLIGEALTMQLLDAAPVAGSASKLLQEQL